MTVPECFVRVPSIRLLVLRRHLVGLSVMVSRERCSRIPSNGKYGIRALPVAGTDLSPISAIGLVFSSFDSRIPLRPTLRILNVSLSYPRCGGCYVAHVQSTNQTIESNEP